MGGCHFECNGFDAVAECLKTIKFCPTSVLYCIGRFLTVASWVIFSMLWIIILMPCWFILIKKTSFEHNFFISIFVKNNNKIGSGCPPTSGQIHQLSGWPNWDPHVVYRRWTSKWDELTAARFRIAPSGLCMHRITLYTNSHE